MIEKVIKAQKDFGLKTAFGFHRLVEGEVKRIRFRGQKAFNALLGLGVFVEADPGERESKDIPVILPEVTEDIIIGIEPIDKIDPPEGIDPDKPDLPSPEEGQTPTVEELEAILKQKDGSIGVLPNGEIQAEEISLDEAGEPESKETPEDLRRSESPIEELTPEQETEGQSEVEEIPIEGQDENKPTRLSNIIDKP